MPITIAYNLKTTDIVYRRLMFARKSTKFSIYPCFNQKIWTKFRRHYNMLQKYKLHKIHAYNQTQFF